MKMHETRVGYMEMQRAYFDSHYLSTGLCKSIQPDSVVGSDNRIEIGFEPQEDWMKMSQGEPHQR